MNIKLDNWIFLPLFWTIFRLVSCGIAMDQKYFCDNPGHSENFVLKRIDMCFCEPYDPTTMDGQTSIVRFPVKIKYL